MVQKKHFRTILIALVIVGGFVAFGYAGIHCPKAASTRTGVGIGRWRYPHGAGKL